MSIRRIKDLLPGYSCKRYPGGTDFYCTKPRDGVYCRLEVRSSGRDGDAVYCYGGVAMVQGPFIIKANSDIRLIADVASDAERGWSILTDADSVDSWERLFAEVGPDFCERAASDSTGKFEAQMSLVARILNAATDMNDIVVPMEMIERIVETPGVVQFRQLKKYYLQGVDLFLRASISGHTPWRGRTIDPLEDQGQNVIIQSLAEHYYVLDLKK